MSDDVRVLDDTSIGKVFLTDDAGDFPQFRCGYCDNAGILEINVLGGSVWSECQYLCKECRSTFLIATEQRLDKGGKHTPRFGKLVEIWREAGPLYAE